jgi:hypothetical protein
MASVKLFLIGLTIGTAQAQTVIYTDRFGQPAGSAIYQGDIRIPITPQTPIVQAPQERPKQQETPPINYSPSTRSDYYIDPRGINYDRPR